MIQADVLILGSGISSLTCAALLAKKGKKVIVLEQYQKPGGYLHCFNRFGLRYDTGAHYVGALEKGQPFHTLLTYLGVYDPDLFIPLDPTGFDIFHFPAFQSQFVKGYESLVQQLEAQFPQEISAIRAYFEKIRTVVSHFPTYEFGDVSDTSVLIEASETSLATVVTGLTSNTKLQCLFYSYCSLHGVAPKDVPFGFHAIVTDSLVRGPHGLKHGGDALAQKFVKQIESLGGQVLTKKRVVKLETTGKLITEVETQDGLKFSSEWVISGIHPKKTFSLLSSQELLTPAFKGRIENLEESTGIFGVYATVHSSPFSPLKNYYFFDSDVPSALFEKLDCKVPATVFVSAADRNGGSGPYALNIHAPSPMEWFSAWKDSKYGARPLEYKEFKKNYAENIFSLIDRYYPGFQASISQYVTSSPLTNLHFNGSPEGSSYGIYHSIKNTGARSLGPRTKVHNLLLTGQNSLFPGLLGAAVSALRTSGHIVGIKPILNELVQMRESV